MGLQEVFITVDDAAQLLGHLGGLIGGKGLLSLVGMPQGMFQQRLAVVDLGLHLIDKGGVALGMLVGHNEE